MPLLNEQNKAVKEWLRVRRFVQERFGKRPDLNAVLFLIGMNELGLPKEGFTKEEKQDLMHIALCRVLEEDGFYTYTHTDEEGWPHFKKNRDLPPMKLVQQERYLKEKVALYFIAKGYLNNV